MELVDVNKIRCDVNDLRCRLFESDFYMTGFEHIDMNDDLHLAVNVSVSLS